MSALIGVLAVIAVLQILINIKRRVYQKALALDSNSPGDPSNEP